MKFTAQEEYGLRCLLQVARDETASMTIPEIADREGLTPAYVAKLMHLLREAGVVDSTRGQKGGYRLAREARQIDVAAVLAVLGGRLYSGEYCGRYPGTEGECVHTVSCSIRSLWMGLDAVVQTALRKTTLADLLCAEMEAASAVDRRSDPPPLIPLQSLVGQA